MTRKVCSRTRELHAKHSGNREDSRGPRNPEQLLLSGPEDVSMRGERSCSAEK